MMETNEIYSVEQETKDIVDLVKERFFEEYFKNGYGIDEMLKLEKNKKGKKYATVEQIEDFFRKHDFIGARIERVMTLNYGAWRNEFGAESTIFINHSFSGYIRKLFAMRDYKLSLKTFNAIIIFTDRGNLELQFIDAGIIRLGVNKINLKKYNLDHYASRFGDMVCAPVLDTVIEKINLSRGDDELETLTGIEICCGNYRLALSNNYNENVLNVYDDSSSEPVILSGEKLLSLLKSRLPVIDTAADDDTDDEQVDKKTVDDIKAALEERCNQAYKEYDEFTEKIRKNWYKQKYNNPGKLNKNVDKSDIYGATIQHVLFLDGFGDYNFDNENDMDTGALMFDNNEYQNKLQKAFCQDFYTTDLRIDGPIVLVTDKGNFEIEMRFYKCIKFKRNTMDLSNIPWDNYWFRYGDVFAVELIGKQITYCTMAIENASLSKGDWLIDWFELQFNSPVSRGTLCFSASAADWMHITLNKGHKISGKYLFNKLKLFDLI